ncbi:MAG: RNA polymerase sigma factor, partial [Planctomycetota bacterium]
EFSRLLQAAVRGLPYVYRVAFVLRHLQNLEYQEIASITGVSADTARVRAYRARELLKERLSPQVDTVWRERGKKKGKGRGRKRPTVTRRRRGSS